MTIATKLSEARLLIERGWCQKLSRNGDSYCALGACNAVDLPWRLSKYFQMRAALMAAIDCDSVVEWNDAPERTQSEVIEAFKRAEHLARDGAE